MFRLGGGRSRGPEQEQQSHNDDSVAPIKPCRSSNKPKQSTSGGSSKATLANIRTFFRLASNHHGSNPRNRNSKDMNRKQSKRVLIKDASERMGGIRRSTSTQFTRSTTNRSSAFMLERVTMSGLILPEELAAFEDAKPFEGNIYSSDDDEEAKEEITADDELGVTAKTDLGCTWKRLDEELQEEEQRIPLHRIPAPESYFEMTKNDNEELGNIQFEFASLREARDAAALRQWPILCIEAELPGDVSTGRTIFSHPLIVEAAESLFVTVQPRQLEPQDDEEEEEDDDSEHHCQQDRRFFCNSSCRTRVRILDDMGIDVITPVDHMTAAEVVSAMVRGLEAYRIRVPQYLTLLLEEEAGKLQVLSKTRFREIKGEAVFGMFDPVMAEVEFAGLDGVLSTRSGALVRQQVVQVTYDSRRLSYGALVRHALRRTGANVIYHDSNDQRIAAQLELKQFEDFRKVQQRYADGVNHEMDEEDNIPSIKVTKHVGNIRASRHCPKPALRNSILRFVPLTDLQATRSNRLIHQERFDEAMHLLSPRQGLIAMQALRAHHSKAFQDVVDVPICSAWNELCCFNNNGGLCDGDVQPSTEKLHYGKTNKGEEEENTESLTEEGEGEDPALLQ